MTDLPEPSGTNPQPIRPRLVLASSSRYRRELLERLEVPFRVDSPEIDETPIAGESAHGLVLRLAIAKARAVASRWPNAVVIGSDQAAVFGERILGKPGSVEAAVRHLLAFAGHRVRFLTGVAVLTTVDNRIESAVDTTSARFRHASEAEVRQYVARDNPLDCAGGIRFEGLGPLLLEAVDTVDPSAAIGLPLIKLGQLLRGAGINPLARDRG